MFWGAEHHMKSQSRFPASTAGWCSSALWARSTARSSTKKQDKKLIKTFGIMWVLLYQCGLNIHKGWQDKSVGPQILHNYLQRNRQIRKYWNMRVWPHMWHGEGWCSSVLSARSTALSSVRILLLVGKNWGGFRIVFSPRWSHSCILRGQRLRIKDTNQLWDN